MARSNFLWGPTGSVSCLASTSERQKQCSAVHRLRNHGLTWYLLYSYILPNISPRNGTAHAVWTIDTRHSSPQVPSAWERGYCDITSSDTIKVITVPGVCQKGYVLILPLALLVLLPHTAIVKTVITQALLETVTHTWIAITNYKTQQGVSRYHKNYSITTTSILGYYNN